MSAATQPAIRLLENQEILGELLHSVSQPLTTLCCSLELSIGKASGQQQEAVSAALEQAERVINQVRLLREYLDAELLVPSARPIRFAGVVMAVVEELSFVAAANQIELKLEGTSEALVAIAEPRLRLALQYLFSLLMEGLPPKAKVILHFEEGRSESLLRSEVIAFGPQLRTGFSSQHSQERDLSTCRKVKLAIASRVLESGGASLELDSDASRLIVRIPHLSTDTV